jgi:hypothetical protein
MTAEQQNMPEWARRERQRDLAWLDENIELFYFAAAAAHEGAGRGAIVVDVTSRPVPGLGHPFGYVIQEEIELAGDEEAKRLVGEYEPATDFVVMLLKHHNRISTYRLRPQPRSDGNEQSVN